MVDPHGVATPLTEVAANLKDFSTYRIWATNPRFPVPSSGIYRFVVDLKQDGGDWDNSFELELPLTVA